MNILSALRKNQEKKKCSLLFCVFHFPTRKLGFLIIVMWKHFDKTSKERSESMKNC